MSDPWGERLVDDFPTQEAAQQDIERCKREDAMYETTQQLMDIAIKAHMQKFGIDRETAQYWIHGAMAGDRIHRDSSQERASRHLRGRFLHGNCNRSIPYS